MTIIEDIYRKHDVTPAPEGSPFPLHNPQILLIGCIDARLPIAEIGIPKGMALIKRNIAALVVNRGEDRADMAATLEFAVVDRKVSHIIVMGHTDCGGIRACLEKRRDLPSVARYLSPLETVRVAVEKQGGDAQAQARMMEQEAVRLSMNNLRSYDCVRWAESAGALNLHGWVMDVRTQGLYILNEKEGVFVTLAEREKV